MFVSPDVPAEASWQPAGRAVANACRQDHPMPSGEQPTGADRAFLRRRYGKARYETVSISFRCWKGCPAIHVAFFSPDMVTVVGNLYWVSCPDLSAGLSALEAKGVIRSLQSVITNDISQAKALRADHGRYGEQREAWLAWAGLSGRAWSVP